MTEVLTADGVAAMVHRLRREFDLSFAHPPSTGDDPGEILLAIRIRDDRFALPMAQIGGLFAGRAVTRLPGPFSDLLGLTGFRGAVVPVFDLGALLGYPPLTSPRWMALSSGRAAIGLAFDRFEGTQRIAVADLGTAADTGTHVRQVARTSEGPRPVVDLPSILATVDRRIRESG